MSTKIYTVFPRMDDSEFHLVAAPSASAALFHVLVSRYDVRVADQAVLAAAIADGVRVDYAANDAVEVQ